MTSEWDEAAFCLDTEVKILKKENEEAKDLLRAMALALGDWYVDIDNLAEHLPDAKKFFETRDHDLSSNRVVEDFDDVMDRVGCLLDRYTNYYWQTRKK